MKTILVKHLSWLWNNFEKMLIILFLATFPLNIRKVFPTFYSYPGGEFNEYLTPSLNWSDMIILFLIINITIKKLISQWKGQKENNSLF